MTTKEKLIPISEVKKMIDEIHKEVYKCSVNKCKKYYLDIKCDLLVLKQKIDAWAKEQEQ